LECDRPISATTSAAVFSKPPSIWEWDDADNSHFADSVDLVRALRDADTAQALNVALRLSG